VLLYYLLLCVFFDKTQWIMSISYVLKPAKKINAKLMNNFVLFWVGKGMRLRRWWSWMLIRTLHRINEVDSNLCFLKINSF